MELTGKFIGPWCRDFDCIPELTEEDKIALYGLIELSNQKNQNDCKRKFNPTRVHPRFALDKTSS